MLINHTDYFFFTLYVFRVCLRGVENLNGKKSGYRFLTLHARENEESLVENILKSIKISTHKLPLFTF
jgi:hypothetical protein